MSSAARARLAELMAEHGRDGALYVEPVPVESTAEDDDQADEPTSMMDALGARVAEYNERRRTFGVR
ncbi:hypothetical protein [Streptomyces cremeus]|uniref:Uncharacterized protein n=1 Tax=Streptomyces cremeus TaxID=66881 RepID=A0ABV5PBV9_STRCM